MSSFDSVYVPCPSCGSRVEFQSKAGGCELEIYTPDSVPPAIAEDLAGTFETCDCGEWVELGLDAPAPRVRMTVTGSYPP